MNRNVCSLGIGILSYLFALLVLLEIVARIFLWYDLRSSPSDLIYKYYPELHQLDGTKHEKDCFDILFLGASVIGNGWENGGIQTILADKLTQKTGRKIRIFNLAVPAHSSLDSYYKYKELINRKFDLVLIYHAINDTRANNCPVDVFQKDYSHYAWYEELNLLALRKESKFLAFPYVFHKLVIKIWRRLNNIEYLPRVFPKKEWLKYGADIKSRESFKNNFEKILSIAHKKKEKVLLMTFAYYVPPDYSYEKFVKGQLSYTYLNYSAPIEEWGDPANVQKGMDAHNEVIKELVKEHKDVLFVDQANLIPKNGMYFRDICHFSHEGWEKFVDNILEIVASSMPAADGK